MAKKKIFTAGLLCGILLTGMLHMDTVFAAPSLSASADTGSVSEGDYVNVDVKIGDNPSISTLGATLNYDSSVLKYDSSTWNNGFSGSDMQMASDTGSEVNLSVVCDDSYAEDGTVVTVRFQAVKESSSIPVTLALRDMADADLAAISDCTVASAVQAPQAAKTDGESDRNDTVDLENPEEASDINVVDEEAGSEEQFQKDTAKTTETTGQIEADVNSSSVAVQNISDTGNGTQTSAIAQSKSSRPDANYKTGIGLGSDALIVGAAAFGILALILAVRRHREDRS